MESDKGETRPRALEGVKVADFSWVVVGPVTGMILAHHGAQVVRVESLSRPDPLRTIPPMKDGVRGLNRAGLFADYNTNKYGLSLDLNQPRGVEVARRLMSWADVVIESFSPGTMKRWGLGYQDISKTKPEIIMLSTSMVGQTGPAARSVGFGVELISLIGFNHFVGWPDRGPTPLLTAYSDYLTPPIGVIAIMAALETRHKTGKGQWIDLSQFEASLHYLAPALLDYGVNGHDAGRQGNRHCCAAPHAAYRCQGEDRWCAISIFTDDEWKTFCRVIGRPEWAGDPRFASVLDRKKNEDELNRLLEGWTVDHAAEEIMSLLQANGIAAGVVADGKDVLNDPQLKHRRHFVPVNHTEMGQYMAQSPSFKLSRTPSEVSAGAPCLGEHSEYVCTQLLGMSDEEFVGLLSEGVLT
ncbi:MAG: CoA transferase [Chloroflexi bacterium]|nr:CoA transferase [Chloroflexota bacterium]